MKHHPLFSYFLRLSMMFFLLITLVLAAPRQNAQAAATRYYVRANGGNDSNSGLSWTQAFKT
ncbi:MAG: hypothetical protein N3D16_11650, partial [Anaerolineales bacterium]|nr:hypothetical protein [Anaerolineales bacterium]